MINFTVNLTKDVSTSNQENGEQSSPHHGPQEVRDPSLSATAEELTEEFEISQTVISVDQYAQEVAARAEGKRDLEHNYGAQGLQPSHRPSNSLIKVDDREEMSPGLRAQLEEYRKPAFSHWLAPQHEEKVNHF